MTKVAKIEGSTDHADSNKTAMLAKVKSIVEGMLKSADIDEVVKNCDALKGHPTVNFEAHVEQLSEVSVMGNAGKRTGNECDYDVDCEDFLDLVDEDDEHEELCEELDEHEIDYMSYMGDVIRDWIKENIIPKVRDGALKDAKEILFNCHDDTIHYNIETGEKLDLIEGDEVEEDEEEGEDN